MRVLPEDISLIPLETSFFRRSKSLTSLDSFNSFFWTADSFWSSIIFFFSSALALLLLFSNNFVPITTPFKPGSALFEASLTSPAFSPKIALKSFSSGVGSVSPFGVTFPIMISPSLTFAPTLIIPFSLSSFVASSPTLGISGVNSSWPLFVSLTSSSTSLTCTLVKRSSLTILSLTTIASSKLYPLQGINATVTFFPRANLPSLVDVPSAIGSPIWILSPSETMGRWFCAVFWLVLLYLRNFIDTRFSPSISVKSSGTSYVLITIFSEST